MLGCAVLWFAFLVTCSLRLVWVLFATDGGICLLQCCTRKFCSLWVLLWWFVVSECCRFAGSLGMWF